MNLLPIYRDHPDLAEMIAGPSVYMIQCADCPHHFPPDQLYPGTDGLLCATCCDRRQDMAWAEWYERLAKEGREGA